MRMEDYTSQTSYSDDGCTALIQAIRNFEWGFIPRRLADLQSTVIDIWDNLTKNLPQDNRKLAEGGLLHFVVAADRDLEMESIHESLRLRTAKALIEAAPNQTKRTEFINKPDLNGMTPLHMAASLRSREFVKYLIEQGAIANSKGHDGKTPLHCAADTLRLDITNLLLDSLTGADRLPYDINLLTPMDMVRCKTEWGTKVDTRSKKEGDIARAIIAFFEKNLSYSPFSRGDEHRDHETPMCHLRVFGKHVLADDIRATLCKPVTELFEGPMPWFQELGHRLSEYEAKRVDQGAEPDEKPPWLSSWVHLPANNVTWVKEAVKMFLAESSELDTILEFINHLEVEGSLVRPGYFTPRTTVDFDKSISADVQCIVLSILDMNTREASNCDRDIKNSRDQSLLEQAFGVVESPRKLEEHQQLLHQGRVGVESMPELEQTLDKYWHPFLCDDDLKERDDDQVLCRYHENLRKEHKKRLEHSCQSSSRHRCQDDISTSKDYDEILVVSRLWIWRINNVVITSYGGGRDRKFSTSRVLPRKIINQMENYNQIDDADIRAKTITNAVLEEVIRQEPYMPGGKSRILDAAGPFASEIARESKDVTDCYALYGRALGKIDKDFKTSIAKETKILLHLDDIISEIAMIRRVREDTRLVSIAYPWSDSDEATVLRPNRWAEPNDSKLKSLEDEALRVRQSLVTLLSLRQREVNTENLINSQFQNRVLFVFTAATVFFAPLSWVTSLMALNIKDFTPENSVWSIRGTAAASTGTVGGFATLMLICLLLPRPQFSAWVKRATRHASDDQGGDKKAKADDARKEVTIHPIPCSTWSISLIRGRKEASKC